MIDSEIVQRLFVYREQGLREVVGWFDDESAEVIATLLGLQLDWDVAGDLCEIGVHHGKSFLLLANGARENERAVALDVFGEQVKNLDNSGLGDRERFEANTARWAAHTQVVVEQASSLELDPATASATFGRVRLFSIDGGHTAAITAHDLRLAEACVVENGIVVLDDLLNAHWLGVISGLVDYLSVEHSLQPFAYSSNKLYLSPSKAWAARYGAALRERLADLLGKKDVEFFGGTVDIYGQGSPRRRAAVAAASRAAVLPGKRPARVGGALRAERAERLRLARELEQARRRVEELTSSTSWRMTAGPRALSEVLRSAYRRISASRSR